MTNRDWLEQRTRELRIELAGRIDEVEAGSRAPVKQFALDVARVNIDTGVVISAWLRLRHGDGAGEPLRQILRGSRSFVEFEPNEPVRDLVRLRSELAAALLEHCSRLLEPFLSVPRTLGTRVSGERPQEPPPEGQSPG